MTVFWRYWALQVPGWILLIGILAAAHRYFSLSLEVAAGVLALWLAKDAALYPLLGRHYAARSGDARERLVGSRAFARQSLSPRGYVMLRGELWLAEAVEGAIAPGEEVIVESVEGLTLRVRRPPSPAG